MKIVYVGTCYPMRGGMAHFNASLARELSHRHQVRMLSFTRQYPGLLFPGKSQFVESGDGAAAARFEATPLLDSIWPPSWWRTADEAVRERPDLLLLTYWMPFFAPAFGTVARRVRRRLGAHVMMLCHNIVPHEQRPFDAALTRYALAPVDSFLVLSEAVEADLRRFRPHAPRRRVRHPVYDLFGQRVEKSAARSELGLDEGPWLLFFGFVRPYKGLDLLLEALAEVRRRRPVKLLVAGEFYEGEQRTRRRVTELGLEEAVVLRSEYIPENRVHLYFSACDVVTLPYRSATQSGIVPIAYHLDAPVICTDVGGLAEVVPHEHAGFVVPPGDVSALAASILRFYDEGWEERLRAGVQVEKVKYSWEALANAVEELAAVGRRT